MTDHTDKLYLAALKHSLEPIVELDAGQILSFEVRSFSGDRAAHGHADPEDVGLHARSSLLARQLEFFQKLHEQDPRLYPALFINVEPALFEHWLSWQDFAPFILQFPLSIGCDLASVSGGMSLSVRHRLQQLREMGARLWLINVDDSLYRLPDDLLNRFDGIKIRERFFWHCFNRKDGAFIARTSAIWGCENVIVEGVENRHHLSFVRAQGLVQGQGFHWRARLSRHAHWH